MATKAELEAELAALRQELSEVSENAREGRDKDSTHSREKDETAGGPTDEAAPGEDDILALLQQLQDEIGDLPQRKPLLTAGAAFALGFLLGRATR